jgi:hypothetical protein
MTMSGYTMMGIALYISWVAHVTSWKIVIPLFILTFAIFWLAISSAWSLIAILARRSADQESALMAINGILSGAPCLYFFLCWLNFSGPRVQFLLQFLLTPRF